MSERTIVEIMDDLDTANQRLEERRRIESEARSAAIAALNEVNKLQKEIDSAIAAAKNTAPRETDWHRSMHPGFRVPAE